MSLDRYYGPGNPVYDDLAYEAMHNQIKERAYAFAEMLRNDPDGKPVEPTEQDYRTFEQWARKQYGDELYNAYAAGGWGDKPDV